VTDPRPHLRALVDALPADGSVTVPVAWVRELLAEPCGQVSAPKLAEAALPNAEPELLIGVAEVAARLGVGKDWVHTHWKKDLPFMVKLSRKKLMCPVSKLERWIETRRRAA
jgi:hypothetical protein